MTATLMAAPAATARPAHRDGNVLRWLAAYTSSMVGDSVYYIALSWAAVQTGSASQAGLVMSVSALPRAVLMLGGGVIADRLGPRRVVIGSDVVRCAAVLAVAALLFLSSPGLWPLAALAFVFGTVDAVFMPAVGALPARVTSRDQLARVQGMRGLAIRFASVVGGPLGGLGVAVGGAAAAFGLAGLLIAVSVPLLVSVRVGEVPTDDRAGGGRAGAAGGGAGAGLEDTAGGRVGAGPHDAAGALAGAGPQDTVGALAGARSQDTAGALGGAGAQDAVGGKPGDGPRSTAWSDLVSGLRYIRRHRVLAPLMLAIALGDLGFVGPLNVGLTLLADERGWGASGMGAVLAGFGVGAGAASLLLTVRGRLPHAGQVAAYAILAGSVAIGALAFAPSLVAAVGTAVLVGLLAGLSGAMCGALLQTQADAAYLGRVTAVSGLVSLGFAPLSMPLSAAAIGAWGTGPVFVVSAAVCGLGGVVALLVRDLRRAELPK
ncbi:MFS transporter [Streptomyces antibioticus]|nr:MFS transporter [Streptomyces antibioticus]KUN19231.1 MFS transporter [Streptomyces antibioticus]